jgi:hypothetical protein
VKGMGVVVRLESDMVLYGSGCSYVKRRRGTSKVEVVFSGREEERLGSRCRSRLVNSIDGSLRVIEYYYGCCGLLFQSLKAAFDLWILGMQRNVGGLDPSEDVRCGQRPLRFEICLLMNCRGAKYF